MCTTYNDKNISEKYKTLSFNFIQGVSDSLPVNYAVAYVVKTYNNWHKNPIP